MLDSIKTYEKYDKHELSFGIERLAEQVHLAWEATRMLKAPAAYKNVQNIVLVGMGGSGLACHLAAEPLRCETKVPVHLVHDYNLPAFVNSKTLVVLVSFSGDTEEVLEAATTAKKKRAKLAVVTSGGALGRFAKKEKAFSYIFQPGELAKLPNLGVGFMFAGVLGLLERTGHAKVSGARIGRVLEAMTDVAESCAINVETENNPAKTVADELKNKSILFVGSEHLTGSVQTIAHQANETAKQYARFMTLPELNHHFLESLSRPVGFFSKFAVVMVKSDHYHKRTQLRYEMTAKVFEKLGGTVIDYEARGKDRLEEVGEMLQFGSFMTYYLGISNKVDLLQIPYVDLIKKKMAKEK